MNNFALELVKYSKCQVCLRISRNIKKNEKQILFLMRFKRAFYIFMLNSLISVDKNFFVWS